MKMGKFLCLVLVILMLLMGCGATRTVTCDGCGTQITVEEDSNVTDEWILYCSACETKLFGEEGLVPKE